MGYTYSEDDDARLNIRDLASALKGDDQAAFKALLVKAVVEIENDTDGLVSSLREQVASLKRSNATLQGRTTALHATLSKLAERDKQIEDLRLTRTVEGVDDLLHEVERLKEAVAMQREIITAYQLETSIKPKDVVRAHKSAISGVPV
jgi:hypothetical protein